MKRAFVISLLLLSLVSAAVLADTSGMIVFTRSQFTQEGFRQFLARDSSNRGWWELYERDICVINPDGTGFMQLTDDGVSYRSRWSPDGQKIAFLSGVPPAVSLHVINADGSDRRELVPSQADIYDFKWSPDGTSILVYLKTRTTIKPEEAQVVKVTDGSSTKRMGSSEWARGWNHWAPQGAEVLNPDKRLIERLPEGIAWPEWSPNGIYLAFIYEGKLIITDTAIANQPEKWRPSKQEPPCDRIGDWLFDSSKLLFFARGNVCSINFDEKDVVNLSMSSAEDACWSPDGSQIAYTSTDGRKTNTEIFIMNSDGTGHIQLTNTNYFHLDLDWK